MKTFTQQVDHFIALLPTMTKEEADFIETVLKWDNDEKAAFILAKRVFETEDDDDCTRRNK
jgi:hypothetical protein